MIFFEPLGSNLLLRLYWLLGKNVHTPDEKPFMRKDLNWLEANFPSFRLIAVNYFSFLFGLISSKFFASPNNWLLRLCDYIDITLAKTEYLKPQYRQGIFIIKKAQH